MSAIVAPETIRAKVAIHLPTITASARGSVDVPEGVEVLTAKRWTLHCYEPTGPEGSYTYMIEDANGKLVAIAEHHDADTALLAVIEDVLPGNEL